MSEVLIEHTQPATFDELLDLISQLVERDGVGLSEDGEETDSEETEIPTWDGTIPQLHLEPTIAAQTGLGDTVKARVIGDGEAGVAFVLRSRYLFRTRRYGFYVQPSQDGETDGFAVWQAPAFNPKRCEVYWGIELLDGQRAQQSSQEITQSFIRSMQQSV